MINPHQTTFTKYLHSEAVKVFSSSVLQSGRIKIYFLKIVCIFWFKDRGAWTMATAWTLECHPQSQRGWVRHYNLPVQKYFATCSVVYTGLCALCTTHYAGFRERSMENIHLHLWFDLRWKMSLDAFQCNLSVKIFKLNMLFVLIF